MQSVALFLLLCATSTVLSSPLQKGVGPRIIGGNPARPGQFPSLVAIYYDTDDGTYFCGGSLIGSQWILTAAHCVVDAKVFTLQLGSVTLQDDDPNRLIVATVNSVPHPRFDINTLENNIGLIKLHLPISYSDHIQPINLADTTFAEGLIVTAVGWGQTGDWGTGVSNELNYVNLATISNEECKRTYGDQINDNMICAIGNYHDGTCKGDNGGPLIGADYNGSPIHIGISSFISQNGCESIDPSGYTRTAAYRDWIRDVTTL